MRFSSSGEMMEYVKSKNKQLQSLGKDIGKWAISGLPVVNENQLESRLCICKGCEFWNSNGFGGTGSCTKCGCSTQAKLRMTTSKCPIDKWGAIDVETPQ